MSGNVGGQDGNQINIKLFNGRTINLKKLDQLVGKSTEGSVFARYDAVNNGGDGDSVFSEAEVSQIKQKLIQYQASDNNVSQDELNQMFGYGQLDTQGKKKNFDVNNLNSLLDAISDEDATTPQSVKGTPPPTHADAETQVLTKYTVQPGDTPEVLAKKLGYTGEEAKAYARKLKEHFKNNNYFTRQGWLKIGQEITLLGEHSEAIKNMSDYSQDYEVLQQRWANSESGQKALAAQKQKQEAAAAAAAEAERLAEEQRRAEELRRAEAAKPKDKTPPAQRADITTVRKGATVAAQALKDQIKPNSLNANTRAMLTEKVKNTNVAYILENYPEMVTDIDNEWGMDIQDIKKYVITPLNSRLRELGKNEHCIDPNAAENMSIEDVQKQCAKVAKIIRDTDTENGYVFIPKEGNEGKIHKPRKASTPTVSTAEAEPKEKAAATTTTRTPQPEERWKYLSMQEINEYPQKLQDQLYKLRSYGIEVTVTKTRDGYKLDLNENFANLGRFMRPFSLEGSPIPKIAGEDTSNLLYSAGFQQGQKTLLLDNEGNLIQQTETFDDRRVVTQYENDQPVVTDTHYNERVDYSTVDAQRTVSSTDRVPVAINIKRPEHLNEEGTKFANALEANKAALMAELGLTNEQYDNLANLAMGIAEQETHFGASSYTTMSGDTQFQGRNLLKDAADSLGLIDAAYDLGIKSGTKSVGMTQLKLGDFEHIKGQFAAFGINSPEDLEDNPENQAIATLIALNNKRVVAESDTWQKRLATNNANISDPNERITTNDLTAFLYNGKSKLLNRFKDPNDVVRISDTSENSKSSAAYARNVRAYTKHYYSVTEEAGSRARSEVLNAESQGNNGKLGSVIFMPTAYTTDVTNSKKDIATLEAALNNNSSIPQALKDKLLMAVRKNEISFGYGLTPDEAASITAKDAQLLLEKLDGLKSRITNLVDPAKIREEARITQNEFRSSYLESRQVIVNNSDVPAGSILSALGADDVVNERLQARGERRIIINEDNVKYFREGANGRSHVTVDGGQYYGFAVEADKGVNPYDANGNYIPQSQRVLAECGSDVAAMMDCGGNCTTGVKASLESAGAVKDRTEIGYTDSNGKWHKCTTARELAIYFEKRPEKFEEVKYVSLGNGTSREINATDITNLPAGLVCVFIPGEGYENQAGHAFITNGNGQGYADEVDNLRWDDFKSQGAGNGKGEHGTFKIYRLKA